MEITFDDETRAALVAAIVAPRGYREDDPWPSRMDVWINEAAKEAVSAHILSLLKDDPTIAVPLDAAVRALVGTLATDERVREGLASALDDWLRWGHEDRT